MYRVNNWFSLLIDQIRRVIFNEVDSVKWLPWFKVISELKYLHIPLLLFFFVAFPPSLARKLKNNRVWEPSAKACSCSIDQLAFRLSLAVVSMTGYCCPFVMITSRQFCQENSCKSLTFEIENTQVFPKDSHVQQIYYLHKLFLKSSWADIFQCSYKVLEKCAKEKKL